MDNNSLAFVLACQAKANSEIVPEYAEAAKASALAAQTAAEEAEESAQSAAESAAECENKLDKPSDSPAVGKVLRVKSVNDDGTFVCEWAEQEAGGVTDVQINGTSTVVDGVSTIPLATTSKVGVASYESQCFQVLSNSVKINQLSEAQISSRTGINNDRRAVTVNRIDFAVKAALTDGKGTAYTTTEQAAARSRIGIISCTSEEYGLISVPIENAIYILTDTKHIYIGSTLFI